MARNKTFVALQVCNNQASDHEQNAHKDFSSSSKRSPKFPRPRKSKS